jgi:hypothetical protein
MRVQACSSMVDLKLLRDEGGELAGAPGNFIALNKFVERRTIENAEDVSAPFDVSIYRLDSYVNDDIPRLLLSLLGEPQITALRVECDVGDDLVAAVRRRIGELPNDWYEIFPADHNVTEGFHFPDPWGETTELLSRLASLVAVTEPPVNHNKVSSKRRDKFGLNELHLDSFEGMRRDENGRRLRIWRYFFNLGENERLTAVVPLNPALVDELIPLDYKPNLLDELVDAAERDLPVVLVPTPGRVGKSISGLKLLTTHMVHGEYGSKGDLLAIVNSLE